MTPRHQLDSFLARYTPAVAKTARAACAWMRKRFPGATVLVYDNYNALVIGFGPSERASEAVLSIALYPRYVTLFFLKGASLADPHHLLKGSGKQVRSLVIENLNLLEDPAVLNLIDQAAAQADFSRSGPSGPLILKSISEKQRPRRPKT